MYRSIRTASGSPHRAVRTGSNSAIVRLTEPGEDPRDGLELTRNAPPGGLGHLSLPDRRDHLLEPFVGDLVVVDVVHGEHRRLVAGGEALLLLQREQAVLGDMLGFVSEELTRAVVEAPPAEQRARRVRANRDHVPP